MMSEEKTIVYEPGYRTKQGLFKTWAVLIANVLASKQLIYQLFRRDFLMMYKKSFLGMGWLIISPIIGILSWVFMNATGVLEPGDVGVPYPAYVLMGTTVWGLFLNLFQGSSQTLSVAASFILQVNFPHDALLAKQALQHFVNFGIMLIVALIALAFFGVFPHWQIIFLPLMVLPVFFLAAAIGLVVSVINVVAIDMERIFAIFMNLVMFATPIIYSANVENELLQTVITWNPLTYIVCGIRDVILFGHIEHLGRYFISAGIALGLFMFSWRLFYITEERVIEKMI